MSHIIRWLRVDTIATTDIVTTLDPATGARRINTAAMRFKYYLINFLLIKNITTNYCISASHPDNDYFIDADPLWSTTGANTAASTTTTADSTDNLGTSCRLMMRLVFEVLTKLTQLSTIIKAKEGETTTNARNRLVIIALHGQLRHWRHQLDHLVFRNRHLVHTSFLARQQAVYNLLTLLNFVVNLLLIVGELILLILAIVAIALAVLIPVVLIIIIIRILIRLIIIAIGVIKKIIRKLRRLIYIKLIFRLKHGPQHPLLDYRGKLFDISVRKKPLGTLKGGEPYHPGAQAQALSVPAKESASEPSKDTAKLKELQAIFEHFGRTINQLTQRQQQLEKLLQAKPNITMTVNNNIHHNYNQLLGLVVLDDKHDTVNQTSSL